MSRTRLSYRTDAVTTSSVGNICNAINTDTVGIAIGVSGVDVVEDIEEINPELRKDTFLYWKILLQCQIRVEEPWAKVAVTTGVPDLIQAWTTEAPRIASCRRAQSIKACKVWPRMTTRVQGTNVRMEAAGISVRETRRCRRMATIVTNTTSAHR